MTRFLVLVLLTLLLAGQVSFAQAPPAGQQAAAAAAPSASPTAVAQGPAAERKSDPVEPQGFTYNPDGRRDPVVSLLRRGAATTDTGKRGGGLAGLGTAEVNLRGTLRSNGSFVGILQGADNKTYIVRAGQKLADGTIRTIEKDSMVIVQHVNDPLADKPRELRKALRQDEAK